MIWGRPYNLSCIGLFFFLCKVDFFLPQRTIRNSIFFLNWSILHMINIWYVPEYYHTHTHTAHIVRWKDASWDVFWVKWFHVGIHDQIHKQTSPKMEHFGSRYVCNDVILLLTLLRNQPNRFSRCCYTKLILLKWRNKHKMSGQKQGGNSKNPWWDMSLFLTPVLLSF